MAQMTAQPRAHARFPEPLQARVLAHLVRMAKLNKSYAWWAAKHYAALHPDELGEMPQMLTQAMRANAGAEPREASASGNLLYGTRKNT